MSFFRKLFSKLRASLYLFRKAEILRNVVNKEIGGEYDNLCSRCFFNERYGEKVQQGELAERGNRLRVSIYLGGALGDYIVYLRFVDEISSVCACDVDLFLDRMEFGQFVFGKRENVTIIHDAENCLFQGSVEHYDLAVHLDHGVTSKHCSLGSIREKAPAFYKTACKIVEHCKRDRVEITDQQQRELVILRRAKFFGETKWSKLSCSGAVDMEEMYSNILLDAGYFAVLERYRLSGQKYITVNYGADKNMGGTAQTKVLPLATLQEFIEGFKAAHPDYLVVQTGVKNSFPLAGADRYAFDCKLEETAVLLKYSCCQIDSEGGLVHLASQLSTPCVVSFGPTPIYYYGYPRNENILSPVCSSCMSTTGQWSRICPRGMQVPACMQAISAEMILERAEKVLRRREKELVPKKLPEEAASLPDAAGGAEICLIGPLDDDLYNAAQRAYRKGGQVTVYIPLSLTADTVEKRSVLRASGIRVEYGDVLNIAKRDHAFDLVAYWGEVITPDMQKYAERELLRLVKSDGRIIRIKAQKEETA